MSGKYCEVCGKVFYPFSGRQKYCCEECAAESRKKRDKDRKAFRLGVKNHHKVCVWCGAEFDTTNNTKIYCSDKCRDESVREKAREYKKSHRKPHGNLKKRTFVCKICGKKFLAYNHNASYCSDKCRSEGALQKSREHDKRQKELRKTKRVCDTCGADFLGSPSDNYCCKECADRGRLRTAVFYKNATKEEVAAFDRNIDEKLSKLSAGDIYQKKYKRDPVLKDVPLTSRQIERLQGIVGISYGKLEQMQRFGTLYDYCVERGITEL